MHLAVSFRGSGPSTGVRIVSKELLSSGKVAKPSGWMVSTGAALLFLVEEASPDDPATHFPQPENVVRMITQEQPLVSYAEFPVLAFPTSLYR